MSNTLEPTNYPFSAVVGQEQLRLALILTAIAPRIGGVVISMVHMHLTLRVSA